MDSEYSFLFIHSALIRELASCSITIAHTVAGMNIFGKKSSSKIPDFTTKLIEFWTPGETKFSECVTLFLYVSFFVL